MLFSPNGTAEAETRDACDAGSATLHGGCMLHASLLMGDTAACNISRKKLGLDKTTQPQLHAPLRPVELGSLHNS
jgi:hypothetical protein